MVKIDNNPPNKTTSSDDNNDEKEIEVKRYQYDTRESTFPMEGMVNGKVVKDNDNDDNNPTMKEIEKDMELSKGKQKETEELPTLEQLKKIDPLLSKRIERLDELEKLTYDDKDLKFVHFPDDEAYRPISLEMIKMNDLESDDQITRLNTRIMMNIAIHDYVIFRDIQDDDRDPIPIKKNFRRVKTHEFQDYVDIQTELDDMVKRVAIVNSKYPFLLEDQDKLYEYQKKLVEIARRRIRKGFEIFFNWKSEEREKIQELYNNFDQNDVGFNVDAAFLRITKSPFLRRKLSPSS